MTRILPLGGRGWDCNQFLLKDPSTNAFDLVDAGHGMDFDHVLAQVAAVIDPARVRTVAVTHEHLDHVNGLPKWQARSARIVTSAPVADKLRRGHDPTSEAFGMSIPVLDVDDEVGEGDHVQLGDAAFACLPSPGHSPGSLCYWHEASGTLFSGDVVFAAGGIGRFDFPDSDLRAHYDSILRLGRLPVRVLHAGHGPSVEGDDAARSVQGSIAHVTACMG